MRVLMVVAALAMAACSPSALQPPADPAPAAAPASGPASTAPPGAEQASCVAKGGEWRPVCRMQQPACVVTFADAGKACSDGDDCAGDCMAKSDAGFAAEGKAVAGFCAVNSDPCGCKQTVEDGKATAAICID
jgi:hypothetical protein